MNVTEIKLFAKKEIDAVRQATAHHKKVIDEYENRKRSGSTILNKHIDPIIDSITHLDRAYETLQQKIHQKPGRAQARDTVFWQIIHSINKELNINPKQLDASVERSLADVKAAQSALLEEARKINQRFLYHYRLFLHYLDILKAKLRLK